MRITTKTGDNGTTGRLFGSRVSKASQAINTVGDVDELNAALGLVKFDLGKEEHYFKVIEKIQHALTLAMGEIAAEQNKRNEYVEKYDYVKDADMTWLDSEVIRLQNMEELDQQGWVLYGNSKRGAFADFAAKVCRRAERSLLLLISEENCVEEAVRGIVVKYLNRLSDFLHLLARYFDHLKTL